LGYEDLNDHDELRRDPVMAVLAGKLEVGRKNCAPVAGRTLNRLELSRETATRYHKIGHDAASIEKLFVTLFLEAHTRRRSRKSSLISTPPTTRCMDIRRGGFSTATMIATAICRSMCSAGGICWRRNCGVPTSMHQPVRLRRWHALWRKSVSDGPRCALFCGPTAALRAMP
jgi:hypothetical protein